MSKTRYTLSADDLIQADFFTKRNAEALLSGLNSSGAAKQLGVNVGGTGTGTFADGQLIQYNAARKQLQSYGAVSFLSRGDAAGVAGGDLMGTYPDPVVKSNAIDATKLANGAVTKEKLLAAGGAPGQVLGLSDTSLVWMDQPSVSSGLLAIFETGQHTFTGQPNTRYICYLKGGGGKSGKPYMFPGSVEGYSGSGGNGGAGGDGGSISCIVSTGVDGVFEIEVGSQEQPTSITKAGGDGVTALPGSNGTDASYTSNDNEAAHGAAGIDGLVEITGSVIILSKLAALEPYGVGGVDTASWAQNSPIAIGLGDSVIGTGGIVIIHL